MLDGLHFLGSVYNLLKITIMTTPNLSWSDRLALIEHFKPSDEVICTTFNVTPKELKVMRGLQTVGTVVPTANLNIAAYADIFDAEPVVISIPEPTPTVITAPQTATRKTKKRGRKGSNITTAFEAITTTPVPVETFLAEFKVSLPVIRQSARFDPTPELGKVRVKQNKETKILMVWREEPND